MESKEFAMLASRKNKTPRKLLRFLHGGGPGRAARGGSQAIIGPDGTIGADGSHFVNAFTSTGGGQSGDGSENGGNGAGDNSDGGNGPAFAQANDAMAWMLLVGIAAVAVALTTVALFVSRRVRR